MGVGAMIGAGIFALLGEAGVIAGSAVWVSFRAYFSPRLADISRASTIRPGITTLDRCE
jgi:hypothetical protein